MSLDSKVVVVTGAASGIGRSIAREASREGASVVVADRDGTLAQEVARELPDAQAVELDVADRTSIRAAVELVLSRSGRVDILCNAAAVWEMQPLLNVDEPSFDRLFSVNVRGLFFTQQAFARVMVERGTGGAIVNVASQAGRRGESASSIYAATKAAVISITQSAALALAPQGIRVNAVAPGCVDTPMWRGVDAAFSAAEGLAPGEKTRQVIASIPLGRLAEPHEVARAAVFLASDDARYVTGQTLNVDGGSFLS